MSAFVTSWMTSMPRSSSTATAWDSTLKCIQHRASPGCPATGCICCSMHRAPVVPGGPEANRNPVGGIASSSRSMTCKRQSMISKQAGATFRGQLVEGQGGNQILVEDPSGNPVELFEPARTG